MEDEKFNQPVVIEDKETIAVMRSLLRVQEKQCDLTAKLIEAIDDLNKNLDVISSIGGLVKSFVGRRKR